MHVNIRKRKGERYFIMRKNQFRAIAGITTMSLFLGLGALAQPADVRAATEHWNDATTSGTNSWSYYTKKWESIRNNWENVSLTPGKNETELNFAWYSKTAETPKVRIGTDKGYNQTEKSESVTGKDVVEFTGKQTTIASGTGGNRSDLTGYYSNKVTITGLKANTNYYYQVFQNGQWQAVQEYDTKSFDQYSFLYVGDPQIGACKNQTDTDGNTMSTGGEYLAARNDAYNWNEVLKKALNAHPNVSFMVSAGDQVNYGDEEREYAGYLSAEALRSLPVSTTIGNHDSSSAQYSYHFHNPNAFSAGDTAYTAGKTAAGTDYYYTYGDVLFIVLDTNNYNCATHENVIKKAVEENKDAKWRVVTFHQDIYGSGYDHSDSDGIVLRTQLTPIMDKYAIDVVLQGHDHTYSRSYQLTSDGKQHKAFTKGDDSKQSDFLEENNCYDVVSTQKSGTIVNPEGTVYFEANSSTGSKFYQLIATKQDYIAERSQTWTPTYSVIDVTDTSFSVSTYDATTQKPVKGSSTYTIVKKDTSSNANTSAQNQQTTATTDKAAQNNAAQTTQSKTEAPKKIAAVKAVAAGKNKVRVTWKKDKKVKGYQIVYSYKKNFTKGVKKINVKKNKTTSATITKLSRGKKVYVKMRSYKKANGKKVFGAFSKVRKVTVR